jgi:hypothetical protein
MRYNQLAHSCLSYLLVEVDSNPDPDFSSMPREVADLFSEAAELVSRAAWSSSFTRWLWLRRRLRRLDRKVHRIKQANPRMKAMAGFAERDFR